VAGLESSPGGGLAYYCSGPGDLTRTYSDQLEAAAVTQPAADRGGGRLSDSVTASGPGVTVRAVNEAVRVQASWPQLEP
jgi:hypothetical protein